MKRTLPAIFVALAALSAQTLDVQLQRAIQKEAATGDLKAAIDEYKKIAARAGSNHALAAQALLREADAYQKLGDAGARKIYEQIVTQYADQKDAVAMAQSRLGGARTNGMVNRPVWEVGNTDPRSVSPDGRYIGFVDYRGDAGGDLALHDLVTGADRRLTKASKGEFVDELAFSPDSKQIAYIWYTKQGSDLRILNLSAPNAAPRIFKNADWDYDTVAWSPDGKYLAVYAGPKEKAQITLISAQDGSSRPLLPATGAISNWLYFSPDGRYLAYNRRANGPGSQRDIFLLAIDSGREIPAIVWPSDDQIMGWSKDGRLLFASDRSGSMGLWAQPFIDGKPQGQPTQIKADIGSGGSLGMTSSGSLYYDVTNRGAQQYLEVAPFDSTAGKILPSPALSVPATQQLQVGEQYDWSPDGKYLAYTTPLNRGTAVAIRSTQTGQSRVVLPANFDFLNNVRWAPDNRTLLASARNHVQLIDTQTDQVSKYEADATVGPGFLIDVPRWSPDQKKIYFRRPNGNGSVAFYESDPELKNAREIIRRPNLGGLNLTPDGRTIVTFVADNGAVAIAVPTAGGEPRELLRRQEAGNIFISPDGKYVAFVRVEAANAKDVPALLVPIGGGQPRQLLSAAAPQVVSMGMWAPDSKSIFLKKSLPDGQQAEIWRVPVDGGQAVKVDLGLNLDQITRYFGISPKGDQIAFIRGTRTPPKSEIWVLEDFLPPLK